MKGVTTVAPVALACGVLAGALAPRASSLAPVTVKGNGKQTGLLRWLSLVDLTNLAFFAGNDRFYIRGVDYQPGGSSDAADPLANKDTCTRDIEEYVLG